MTIKKQVSLIVLVVFLAATIVRGQDPSTPRDAKRLYGQGKTALDKGDLALAISSFTEAIRLDSKDGKAYTARGIAYGRTGEYNTAIVDSSEAIRLDPKLVAAYGTRGFAYLKKGDYDKAIGDYSEAIRLDPKLARAYGNRGLAYLKKGDYDKAIADYSEAIRLDPKIARRYTGRGIAYKCKGDLDNAINDFAEVTRLNPKDAEAYDRLGNAFEAKGDVDKAIAAATEAIRLAPVSASYHEARGAMLIKRGDYDGGVADLHTAIRLDPKDPAAKFESWQKQPLTAAAIQHGEEQVRQMLRDRPAMAQFGEKAKVLCQWAARKFAGEDLQKEIFWDATEPDGSDAVSYPPTANKPGRIRLRKTYSDGANKGKELTCEDMWNHAVFELYNVENAEEFQRLTLDAVDGKLTKETFATKMVECETRAVVKTRAFYVHVFLPWAKEHHAPSDPKSWYVATRLDSREPFRLYVDKPGAYWRNLEDQYDIVIMNSVVEKREYEKSIELTGKMLDQATTRTTMAAVFLARGIAYDHHGDYDKAISDYTEAIHLFPEEGTSYKDRAFSYLHNGDYDKAIADCTEAIRLNPQDGEAFYNRGGVHKKKGDNAKAGEDFARAKELGYKGN